MKKKKTRTLLLLCGFLLLLIGAYIGVMTYNHAEEKTEQTVTVAAEQVTLAVLDGTVTSVRIEAEEGTLEFALKDEVWTEVNHEGLDIIQSYMNKLTAAFTGLSTTHTIEENTENLAEYGLDKPKLVLTGKNTDGKEAVIYVGLQNAVTSEYYICTGSEPGVYTVAAVNLAYFTRSLMDFAVVPEYKYGETGSFESFEIVNGEEHMKAEVLEESDYNISGLMNWYVTEPYEHEYAAHTTTLDELMAAAADLSYSKADSYNPDAAELEKMGLAAPEKELAFSYTVTSEETGEEELVSYRLYVGNQKEGTDYYYVQEEGSKLVLLMKKDALDSVLSYTARDIVYKYFAIINIDTVESIDIELDGAVYQFIPPQDNDADEDEKRDLYQTIIAAHAEKITEDVTENVELLPLRITFHRNEKPETYLIQFAAYDNNFCRAIVDGEGIYLVNKRDYEQYCADIKAGFETLK